MVDVRYDLRLGIAHALPVVRGASIERDLRGGQARVDNAIEYQLLLLGDTVSGLTSAQRMLW
jgi:hypothetical protein